MRGTFGARLDKLQESVGHGHLVGSVEVDQVYAHFQHERPELHHPDGGGPYYLRDPLFEGINAAMEKLAMAAFTRDGSDLKAGMRDWAENISAEVYKRAPVEFADLKASGHPKVVDDDATFYDRAPAVPRLTDEEIRIKNHLRELFEPGRYVR